MSSNKRLILVCTKSHVERILELINDSTIIVAIEYGAQAELDRRKISYRIPEDYTSNETYNDLDKEAISFARKWYSLDSQVKDLVTYKNINLGELVEWEFTYYIAGILKYIKMMDCIFKKEQPDKIIVVDDNPKVNSIVESDDEGLAIKTAVFLANKKNIAVKIVKVKSESNLLHNKTIRYGVLFLIVKILNFRHRLINLNKNKNQKRILVTANSNLLGSAIKELNASDENEIIMFGRTYNISKKSIQNDVLYRSFRDYKIFFFEDSMDLKINWVHLKNNKKFKELCFYGDISIEDLIEERFSYLFHKRFPRLIQDIEQINNMLDHICIDIIVMAYGTIEFEKTLSTVAEKKGVKRLLVQHGVISIPKWFAPCADKMAAYGAGSCDKLFATGWKTNQIVVTGVPRYDILFKKKIDDNSIYNQLGLDIDKKLFVFASQIAGGKIGFGNIHLSLHEGKELLNAMINLMKEFSNDQLVIKLRSSKEINMAQKLVDESNLDNIKITLDTDIYKLINACDILMTPWSTVALEAMIADKPVVTINLTGRPDVQPYEKESAAVGVYSKDDLADIVYKVLYNKKIRKNLEKNRKKFVIKNAYLQDGKASERVANQIIKMMDE